MTISRSTLPQFGFIQYPHYSCYNAIKHSMSPEVQRFNHSPHHMNAASTLHAFNQSQADSDAQLGADWLSRLSIITLGCFHSGQLSDSEAELLPLITVKTGAGANNQTDECRSYLSKDGVLTNRGEQTVSERVILDDILTPDVDGEAHRALRLN